MQEEMDPNTIEDEQVREMVRSLMNLVETLSTKVEQQAEEIQRLRDENQRLKGEQGKPKVRAKAKASPVWSSEQERRVSKAHHKSSKHAQMVIDRIEVLSRDRQTMPADVQFKGYQQVIVQDLQVRSETIAFRKEKYYSPAEQRTYVAELPEGYEGQFGPHVKAWVLTLYYAGGMSEPKILDVLQTAGLSMSAGQLSALLIKNQQPFHAEHAAIVEAGLASSPWQHLDTTGTRLFGVHQQCHILCNPLYTAYQTRPRKDRLSLLRVLQAGAELVFELNQRACEVLEELGVTEKWRRLLPQLLLPDHRYSEAELDAVLDRHLPTYGEKLRTSVKEAMAIGSYQSQSLFPVIKLLVCDDASQFVHLTQERALCWVHEYRPYKKLIPRFLLHCQILQQFAKEFWQFYRDLLAYREAPSQAEAEKLEQRFDQLFGQSRGYQPLDERLAKTHAKKEALLKVLSHPEIPLHNNPAELGARQRVRKRDVSVQARTPEGLAAWDTFQTIVETARKLGVNLFAYLSDRITHRSHLPRLADLITQRATTLPLAASWMTL